MIDFTAYRHPVLAVACPHCKARPGTWCRRPSEHKAMMYLHEGRKKRADEIFIDQHGERASIERAGDHWLVNPQGRAGRTETEPNHQQQDLFT